MRVTSSHGVPRYSRVRRGGLLDWVRAGACAGAGWQGRAVWLAVFVALPRLRHDFARAVKTIFAPGYREIETLDVLDWNSGYFRDARARNGLTAPSRRIVPGKVIICFSRLPVAEVEKAARFIDPLLAA